MTASWSRSWTRQWEAPRFLPWPSSVLFTWLPHSQKLPQGCSLERVMWCWDHLGRVHDGTQLRPLYKFLRFGAQVKKICLLILRPPKASLVCKFPCLLNPPPSKLVGLPLSLVSYWPLRMGASFRFCLGSSKGGYKPPLSHPGLSSVSHLSLNHYCIIYKVRILLNPAQPIPWAFGKFCETTHGKSFAHYKSQVHMGCFFHRLSF